MLAPPEFFQDIDGLLDGSRPKFSRLRFWQAGLIFVAMVILGALMARQQETLGPLMDVLSGLIFIGLIGAFFGISSSSLRRFRRETAMIHAVEELVQLRYWPQAAAALRGLLSRPMNLPSNRNHALMLLGGVLSRYNLFDSALRIQQSLLDDHQLDPLSEMTIRLARAATLLREDRLFDADRAIVEMRRNINRLRDTPAAEAPAAMLSAGLTLVELYRDVKTGHPNEAIELFNTRRSLLRDQLGHRVAEAFVLAAQAHLLLGHTNEADCLYRDATTLAPAVELHRRFPETDALSTRFVTLPAPAGTT